MSRKLVLLVAVVVCLLGPLQHSIAASSSAFNIYLVKAVKVEYPEAAKQRRIQGVVVIEILIGRDGVILSATVVKSVDPLLDEAALQAVQHWKYKPPVLDGRLVEVIDKIPINFTL